MLENKVVLYLLFQYESTNAIMQTTLLKYCLENWPIITLLLVIIIGVAVAAWRIACVFTLWKESHKNMHEEANRKFEENEKKHKELADINKNILSRLDTLERYLIKNGGADYNTFTQMNSPRQLNPKGRKLYKESGAENFLLNKKDVLLRMLSSEMNKIRVKTALDVEMCAQRLCYDISGNEDFKPIKDFIYTHPIFEGANVSINTISMLMGLELRNEYLKLHPEIDPTVE